MDPITTAIENSIANINTESDSTPAEAPGSVETAADAGNGDGDQNETAPVTDSAEVPDPTAQKPSETPTDKSKADPADKDDLLKELTYTGKRENRLPHSRVRDLVAKARTQTAAEWEGKLKEHTTRLSEYEQVVGRVGQLEDVMFNEPDRFIEILKTRIPGYAERLAAHAAAQGSPDADMPQPDVRLTDGSSTYSVEGLKRLLAWQAEQVEQRVEQRYKPRRSSM
jgi:hypothetical protein